MAEENTAPIKDDAAVETTEVVEEVVETTGEEKFAKSGKKSKKHIEEGKAEEEGQDR